MSAERFLCEAIDLARDNVRRGGRPFGAVLVKDGRTIATGVNEIAVTGDPTTHAELQAIRAASRVLGSPRLDGCVIYAQRPSVSDVPGGDASHRHHRSHLRLFQ